jgi:hypothetical protein
LDLQDGAGCDGGDGPLRDKSDESEHNVSVPTHSDQPFPLIPIGGSD